MISVLEQLLGVLLVYAECGLGVIVIALLYVAACRVLDRMRDVHQRRWQEECARCRAEALRQSPAAERRASVAPRYSDPLKVIGGGSRGPDIPPGRVGRR